MKNRLVKILTLSAIILCALVLTSCTSDAVDIHYHTEAVRIENEKSTFCDAVGTYEEVTYCTECEDVISRIERTTPAGEHTMDGNECTVCGFLSPSIGLTYAVNGLGTYSVTGLGSCSDRTVVIPGEYRGVWVTSIADYAFESEGITKIILSLL